jgi:hypothetical protein
MCKHRLCSTRFRYINCESILLLCCSDIGVFIQKGVSAYMDHRPHKFPKRSPAKEGLRKRTHFDPKQRRMFDSLAEQYYYDLMSDTSTETTRRTSRASSQEPISLPQIFSSTLPTRSTCKKSPGAMMTTFFNPTTTTKRVDVVLSTLWFRFFDHDA